MLFSENFKIALRALRANRLRSILTILGIVIGVATVVALLAIRKGATANVTGVMQAQKEVRSLEVADGRFITDGDNKSDALVAVLGSQVATDLFSSVSPVGKTISINGVKFEIVGILKEKGSSIGSPDDAVFIPIQTGYD